MEAANKEKSKGIAVYVLVEDDAEVLRNTNKKLDELLQCFWVCVLINSVFAHKTCSLSGRLKTILQGQLS